MPEFDDTPGIANAVTQILHEAKAIQTRFLIEHRMTWLQVRALNPKEREALQLIYKRWLRKTKRA